MNISSATRQALIPIERKIRKEPVEHFVALDKANKLLCENQGKDNSVDIKHRWYSIFLPNDKKLTHNHPNATKNTLKLSINDIYHGIIGGFQEVRAVSQDGYCALVEIPKMGLFEKIKWRKKLLEYDKSLEKSKKQIEINSELHMEHAVKMIKEQNIIEIKKQIETNAHLKILCSLELTQKEKEEKLIEIADSQVAKILKNIRKTLEKEAGFKFRQIKLP